MPADPPAPAAAFREQLTVPVRWWLVALFFVVSVFVAVGFYLLPLTGLVAALICTGVVVAVLVPYGSLTVSVDDRALTVGASRIEWTWVGGAKALDPAETRHRLGPGADVRAHLAMRPYLPEAVEVAIDDPADPHPYWLVSSRRAVELAAAINARSLPVREETTNAES